MQKKLIQTPIEITLDKVTEFFLNHIETDNNNQIVFSGKYGIGKSYFLNHFFNQDSIKEKYNTITLSPVNYVVSANEDIFELIKVDIIKQFYLNNELQFINGDISFDKLTISKEYIKKQWKSISKTPLKYTSNFVSILCKLGVAGDVASKNEGAITKVIQDFNTFEKELNEEHKPTENKLDEYGSEFQNKIGTYLEFNLITQIIKEIIDGIKKKSNKDNILIIEDFDRLDPSHIFRMLNILSAHHQNEEGNKFGFDKVIIVCDLNNIKSLYHHVYGIKTDFAGYMDKFYSVEPFYFDNKKAIYFFIKNQLKIDLDEIALDFLSDLIVLFLDAKIITLRSLNKVRSFVKKPDKLFIEHDTEKITNSEDSTKFREKLGFLNHISNSLVLNFKYSDFPLVEIIEFLQCLLGGYDEMIIKLKEIRESKIILSEKTNIQNNFPKLSCIIYQLIIEKKNIINVIDLPYIGSQILISFQSPDITNKYEITWNSQNKYSIEKSFLEGLKFIDAKDKKTMNTTDDFITRFLTIIFQLKTEDKL